MTANYYPGGHADLIQSDSRDVERKILSILRVLSGSSEPLGSTAIANLLPGLSNVPRLRRNWQGF